MTRANPDQLKHTPWFAKAGAACSIVPISRFVGPNIFALKGGGYGCLFSLSGLDEEGLTDLELESRVRSIEGALRGMPEGSCLYQYTRVMSGFELPRPNSYANEVTEAFASDRLDYLEKNAAFRRIDLHWCLTLEPSQVKAFERKPQENAIETSRMLADLEKTATLLEGHLGSSLGLRLLAKTEAFQFFSYLFNLEEWAGQDHLRDDTGVDRQIVKSPVAWHSDHVQVGKRHVQMFSLKTTPEASRPCLFSGLLTLDCNSVLCSTWRVKSASAARSEIDAQEKFISFFKVGVLTRVMSGRDTASLETGAGAKAANNNVDDLSEVIRSLDKKAQGEFSLRLLLAAPSPEALRGIVPAVHRIFVDARAQVMEETLGNLSAFYAMFPGNHKFNVFPLWLAEDHHARLSSVFAPNIGHPHSEDLDSEYLNVFETRTRTPFFQDVYVDGVRVMLILGPTGTGKSVHGNQIISLEQKYGGFTYVFDIGGSYESVVELYGGRVDRVGKDGPRVNPFALEPTESNIKFLYSFIKLLLTNGGAELEPEDDDVIHKAVQDMYLLDAHNRRLSNLFLPKKLDRYLSKWIGKGIRYVLEGQNAVEPIMSAEKARDQARTRPFLNDSQRRVIEEVLNSSDRIHGLQGLAGTGKTTTLQTIREGAEASGYIVEGFAPTSKAAGQLRKAGIDAATLQSFLARGQNHPSADSANRHLYMLDESSLASTRQMHSFLGKLNPDDRILVIGDIRQHQGVEAGRPFQQMQDAGMQTSHLDRIMRQRDPELLKAVQYLANNETVKGIALLAEQGRVTEISNGHDRIAAIARDYAAHPENTIIISPDNRSRQQINEAVRGELRRNGTLEEDGQVFRTLSHRSDMTGADRRWAGRYSEGDVLQYNTGSKIEGINRNSFATVRSVDTRANTLTVELESGASVTYDPRRLRGVNVFREVEREFATGERLQFTLPNKDLRVANRDLGTVTGLENGAMTVQLDGKFPRNVTFNTAEFRQFDRGYAVTSHSSQGLTAGRVLVNIDTDSSRNLINTRLAYVAISRAADDVRVYTNNAETLGERLASDITKTAAHDLALSTSGGSDLPRHEIMSPSATKSRIPVPALREIEHEGFGIAR